MLKLSNQTKHFVQRAQSHPDESSMTATPPLDAEPSGASDASWSIAEVERETGLGKDTLRVWERRYGFPVPGRDAWGERVYPEEQLQHLRMIKRALDAGHRPGKVVPLSLSDLQRKLDELAGMSSTNVATELSDLQQEEEWIRWLSQDQTPLIKQALQQQIYRRGLGHVVDELVAPLCSRVGVAWMRGEISVYQEHLFTETLQSVLREAIASVDAALQGQHQRPRVLLTTTPGEMHGLGLLMAECHMALESCERFVLGTSTPISDIVQAMRQLPADVLALSFSAYASRKDVLDNLLQLREQLPPDQEIWAGGAAASACGHLLPKGVLLMRKASDVSVQVQAWRRQRA